MKWKGKRKSGKGKGEGKELKNERGAVAAVRWLNNRGVKLELVGSS